MTVSMYVVVSLGMALALAGLALALMQGRQEPRHRTLWVIALIALGIDVALHVVLSVGTVVSGGIEGAWVVIGSGAIAIVLITALIAPQVAGWTFAASGVLLPFVLIAADAMIADTSTEQIPVGLMLAVYSSRALLVGALLVMSGTGRNDSTQQGPPKSRPTAIAEPTEQLIGTQEPKRR